MIKNDILLFKMIKGFVDDFENFSFDSLEEYIKNNYKPSKFSFFDFKNKYEDVFIKNIVSYYVFIYSSNNKDGDDKNINISIFYDTKNCGFLFYYDIYNKKDDPVLYYCKTGSVIYNLFNYICKFCNSVCVEVNELKE